MEKKKQLPYGPLGFPNVRAWGMAPPMEPSDLDPVEAAASPISPDPQLRRRPAGDQGTAAFAAVLEDAGGDINAAVRMFASELTASGVDPSRAAQAARARAAQYQSLSQDPNIFYEGMGTPLLTARQPRQAAPTPAGYAAYAEGMAQADDGMTRAERRAKADARVRGWDSKEAAYNDATGLGAPGAAEDGVGPYPGAGRPGYDRTLTYEEVMASRSEAENARAARVQPMIDSATKEMRDRAQWRADNPDQSERESVRQRERSEDYAKERLLYRMAKQTGQSVEELRAANPQFGSVGQIPSRNGAGIPTLSRTKEGMQLRDMPTSTSSMRDAAAQKRIDAAAKREEAWRSQMMLAGGRPMGGPTGTKATTAAFDRLTPEQQQEVIQSRMRYGDRNGQRGDEWDRRLDLLRVENEARFKEAESARAEDRDEREKDRTLTREERQAAREADERRFEEERARRDLEWKERSRQFDIQQLEGQRRGEQQGTALAAQLAQIQNQGEVSRAELGLAREKQDAALAAAARAQTLADQARREQEASSMYGPGAVQILRKNYDHPSAQAAFRNMAAKADQTWNGFFTDDAARLDSMLVSIGITDPEQRRAIVQEYGINSDIPGQQGRGSILSAWRVAHPDYATVPQ